MQLYPGEGPVCDFCFVETEPQPNCDCAEDCPCHRFVHDPEEDPPRARFVQHVGLQCLSQRFNPRYSWTYCDEDFVGRVKGIAESCTKARGL